MARSSDEEMNALMLTDLADMVIGGEGRKYKILTCFLAIFVPFKDPKKAEYGK